MITVDESAWKQQWSSTTLSDTIPPIPRIGQRLMTHDRRQGHLGQAMGSWRLDVTANREDGDADIQGT
jgi:hypothetical protein